MNGLVNLWHNGTSSMKFVKYGTSPALQHRSTVAASSWRQIIHSQSIFHWFDSSIQSNRQCLTTYRHCKHFSYPQYQNINHFLISNNFLQPNDLRECWMKNLPSVTWLISFLVCRWKLSCQIIFLPRKRPLMVFSPYEFDAGRGLICCISDKIRERRQGSAVICFNNRNSLINAKRTEGDLLKWRS